MQVRAFDEYKCAEKIDIKRLHEVICDLREGHGQRERAIAKLKAVIAQLNS